MSSTNRYFSPDYATARERFVSAVAARNGRLDSLRIPGAGPSGEALSIDIGWFGDPAPRRVLVHSSGLHGVEGYAGAAIQLQWLDEGLPALHAGTAIVIAHMLNPYGCAWLRRVNENNVDLNRNFRAVNAQYAEADREYAALDALLNPPSPPSRDFFYARAAWLLSHRGMAQLRQAVVGGQTVNPRGLFYAGTRLEAGPAAYQAYLATRLAQAESIVAIDVHTGLGHYGEDTLLVDAASGNAHANERMRQAFGTSVQADDTGFAYHALGTQQEMYARALPRARLHFATQEFGTLHPLRVLAALRAENRWHQYGGGAIDHPAKQRLLRVFYPASTAWRDRVLRRGRVVAAQACVLAFGNDPPAA